MGNGTSSPSQQQFTTEATLLVEMPQNVPHLRSLHQLTSQKAKSKTRFTRPFAHRLGDSCPPIKHQPTHSISFLMEASVASQCRARPYLLGELGAGWDGMGWDAPNVDRIQWRRLRLSADVMEPPTPTAPAVAEAKLSSKRRPLFLALSINIFPPVFCVARLCSKREKKKIIVAWRRRSSMHLTRRENKRGSTKSHV